jgi:hypothetical protein
MDIDLALLADAATIDSSGKLNLLGIFDRIGARNFPLKYGRISLVLRFSAGIADAGAHEVVLQLKDPTGGQVLTLNGNIQLGASPAGAGGGRLLVPHILNLDGLVFQHPGIYSFEVSLDGDHVLSIPLTVTQVTGPGGAPPVGPPTGPVAQA